LIEPLPQPILKQIYQNPELEELNNYISDFSERKTAFNSRFFFSSSPIIFLLFHLLFSLPIRMFQRFYELMCEYEEAVKETQQIQSSIEKLELSVDFLIKEAWETQEKKIVSESVGIFLFSSCSHFAKSWNVCFTLPWWRNANAATKSSIQFQQRRLIFSQILFPNSHLLLSPCEMSSTSTLPGAYFRWKPQSLPFKTFLTFFFKNRCSIWYIWFHDPKVISVLVKQLNTIHAGFWYSLFGKK